MPCSSELSVDFSFGLFFNELLQIVKNLSVCVFEVYAPGDSMLFRVKSRDLWFRTGQEGDLKAKCSCYSAMLNFTVDRIEALSC